MPDERLTGAIEARRRSAFGLRDSAHAQAYYASSNEVRAYPLQRVIVTRSCTAGSARPRRLRFPFAIYAIVHGVKGSLQAGLPASRTKVFSTFEIAYNSRGRSVNYAAAPKSAFS